MFNGKNFQGEISCRSGEFFVKAWSFEKYKALIIMLIYVIIHNNRSLHLQLSQRCGISWPWMADNNSTTKLRH